MEHEYTSYLRHRVVLCALEDMARSMASCGGSAQLASGASRAAEQLGDVLRLHRDAQALLALDCVRGQHQGSAAGEEPQTVAGRLLREPLQEVASSLGSNRQQTQEQQQQAKKQQQAQAQQQVGMQDEQASALEHVRQGLQQQLAATRGWLAEALGDPDASADAAAQLAAELAESVRRLAGRRDELAAAALAQRVQHVSHLADAASSLSAIVTGGRTGDGREASEAALALLEAQSLALSGKLQVLHARVQADTYPADAVAALRAARAELAASSAATATALARERGRLAQYGGLGTGYEELAARYGGVLEELAHARYDLEEVRGLEGDLLSQQRM